MRKQTRADRLVRLREMRCPVHGIGLGQDDLEVASCPRKDCGIRVNVESVSGVLLTAQMPDGHILQVLNEEE